MLWFELKQKFYFLVDAYIVRENKSDFTPCPIIPSVQSIPAAGLPLKQVDMRIQL